MVPSHLSKLACCAGTAALAAALSAPSCGRGEPASSDTSQTARHAELVRREYRASDIIAAGAFTWVASPGVTWVMVDAQSTINGLVQARADLWMVTDSGAQAVARSDVMPATAEFAAWHFEDLSGDGLPDLFGYVADSAGISYPVFLPGATGALTEEIASSAPGYVFAIEDSVPAPLASPPRACAIRLWAEAPAPDSQPAGWRYLALLPDGRLMAPRREAPICDGGHPTAGIPR